MVIKMKRKIVQTITVIFIMFAIVNIANVVYADDINPDDFTAIYSKTGVNNLDNKMGQILGIVQIAGTSISIIALIALGIKYMLSSPDEKATVKEKLTPYVIGTIIFFAATNLVSIISRFAFKL